MNQMFVGAKNGCFTVIGTPDVWRLQVVQKEIDKLERRKFEIINNLPFSEKLSSAESLAACDKRLSWEYERLKHEQWQCQCKCGKIYYLTPDVFFRKRWRSCKGFGRSGEECGLDIERRNKLQSNYRREFGKNYNVNYVGRNHESLFVEECIDENYSLVISTRNRKKDGIIMVYKLYRCRCYLCGKEYVFKCSDFDIECNRYDWNRYGSIASCKCHVTSSFQWVVNMILQQYGVSYCVEKTFDGLYGIGGVNLLRYDFALLDSHGEVKCLLECQGEQHYEPVDNFGGAKSFVSQQHNDILKRKYADDHGILLLEIPYWKKSISSVESFLREHCIIEDVRFDGGSIV